jgi:hypothetical protein
MRQRYSRPGALLACAALLLGCAIAGIGAGPADAAPARGAKAQLTKSAKPAKTAKVEAAKVTGSIEPEAAYSKAGPEDAGCLTARRKLFVPDEGWIVRKVTTCR